MLGTRVAFTNMGKKEKRKSEGDVEEGGKESNYEELAKRVGPIANPLASRKLAKRLYKVIKKGIAFKT